MGHKRQPKREALLQSMPVGGLCAEIGVWKGDFSARILDVTQPTTLHLIDPWHHEPGEAYRDAWYGGRLDAGQAQMDAVFNSVVERFAPELAAGTVVIHRAASVDAAPAFADGSLDWVYIDGNHFYEFVKVDLELWSRKLKPGGLLTGDDYRDGGGWDGGVKRAVDEFAAQRHLEPRFIGRQFILRMP